MKAHDRRQQVLAVARDVFAEKGYHATKIDDVVERARIARGTFYLYFKDKRAVFGELIDDLLRRLRLSIERVDVQSPGGIAPQLRANVHRVLTTLFEERALTKILVSDAVGLDPGFDEKLLSFYDQVSEVIEGSLEEGQRLGIVRPCNRKIAACAVIGSVKELCYRTIFGRFCVSVDEAVDTLMELHGRALLQMDLGSLLSAQTTLAAQRPAGLGEPEKITSSPTAAAHLPASLCRTPAGLVDVAMATPSSPPGPCDKNL